MSESAVPAHTAGIIPSIHTSKHYGRVLFYDFAGDAEYYSSHAAILENLTCSSKGDNLFVIVVDLREERVEMRRLLYYWLSFIQHQKFKGREPSLLVVGSHSDEVSKEKVKECGVELERFCESLEAGDGVSNKVEFFVGNCRDPKGRHISGIQSQIASLTKDSPRHQLSFAASILLGLLEKDFGQEPAFAVTELQAHIEAIGIGLLPELHSILEELHELGLVFVVREENGDPLQVIFNISKLTNEAHRLLFSLAAVARLREACEESEGSTACLNIGVLPQALLQRVLPANITQECLVQLQYCQQLRQQDLGAFPTLPQSGSDQQSFLFFPALCRADKRKMSWVTPAELSYSIGWVARCRDARDYFPPRFLHVLLLRLVFRFTLSAARGELAAGEGVEGSVFQRRCTMWKTGVHWLMEEGVECMVELVHGNKAVAVIIKSERECRENCTSVFSGVVSCVMEAKAEFCHSTRPDFFLLDSTEEVDSLREDNLFAMREVEAALMQSKDAAQQVIVSITGRKKMKLSRLLGLRKLSLWNSLFPLDFVSVLCLLEDVVRDLYELGVYLGVPAGLLDAIEEDFAGDVGKRRREVVRAWLNSSPHTPCWWQLVRALRRLHHNVLASNICKQQGKFRRTHCVLMTDGASWLCV